VEDVNQTSLALQLTTQFHVDCQFGTKDLTLGIEDFTDAFITPAVAAIGNKIDRDCLVAATLATANIVGVAGTAPTSLRSYLDAQAYLTAEGAPMEGRTIILDPFSNSAIVDGLKGLLVPQAQVGLQFTKGMMGRDTTGADWKIDANVIGQTFGSWATTAGTLTAATNGAFTGSISTGWAETSTITLTNSQTLTLQAGDCFTIANVFGVNPQSRASYGKLRNFSVQTAVTGAAGTISVTVKPAIITAGQFQNVFVAATSATATVTPFSIAGTTATAITGPQNLVFHKNAFTIGFADLVLPKGMDMAGRASDPGAGASIRLIRNYTINNDALPARLDVLYGIKALYPELSCRVSS
jgi:hypothetical protein